MTCYFCGEESEKPLCKICNQYLEIETYQKEWDLGFDSEFFSETSTEVRLKFKEGKPCKSH